MLGCCLLLRYRADDGLSKMQMYEPSGARRDVGKFSTVPTCSTFFSAQRIAISTIDTLPP